MQHNKQLLTGLNPEPLLRLIDQHPDLWRQITLRQAYPGSAHTDTETIYLVGPEEFTADSYFNDIGAMPYPAFETLGREAHALIDPVLEKVGQKLMGRILIVKLKPGGHVKQHVDEGKYADHYSRFHIVLSTNAGCVNTTGGEAVHWPAGTAWWFDHKQPHTADNGGDTDRVHIIFDAVTRMFKTPNQLAGRNSI